MLNFGSFCLKCFKLWDYSKRVTVIKTAIKFPLSAFLTLPRIVYQAAILKFKHHLSHFTKPIPTSPNTIKVAPPSFSQKTWIKLVTTILKKLDTGHLQLTLPDQTLQSYGNPKSPTRHLTIYDYAFFSRCAKYSDIGFGEAYMNGEFQTDDLTKLIILLEPLL